MSLHTGGDKKWTGKAAEEEAKELPPKKEADQPRSNPRAAEERPAKEEQPAKKARSGWGTVFAIAIVLTVALFLSAWAYFIKAMASYSPLDTQFYAEMNKDSQSYADIPLSTLYRQHFSERPRVEEMTQEQKDALAGAWIRFLRNPDGMMKIKAEHRDFYLSAFHEMLGDMPMGAKLRGLLDQQELKEISEKGGFHRPERRHSEQPDV